MLKFGKSNYGIPYNQQHHFYQHKLWGELKKKKKLNGNIHDLQLFGIYKESVTVVCFIIMLLMKIRIVHVKFNYWS